MGEPKIEFIWDTAVTQIYSGELVKQLMLKNTNDAKISTSPMNSWNRRFQGYLLLEMALLLPYQQ
jgi:hypothetical protein